MGTSEKRVALDADYFNKLTENDADGILFLKILQELDVSPVVHKYIYDEELFANCTAKKLVENGTIVVISYDEYLSKEQRDRYEIMFKLVYQRFNGEAFEENSHYDVYSYRKAGENLGEIRTALMAQYMNIGIMLSDDGAAKTYVENNMRIAGEAMVVRNIYDTLVIIGGKNDRAMKWSEIKGLAKRVFKNSDKKYKAIQAIWA